MNFKHFSKTTKLFAGLIGGVVVITVIIISISGNEMPKKTTVQYINDNASADNKVETLKTMTADLLAVESQNKQLQQQVDTLQTEHQKATDALKQSITDKMQKALEQIKIQNQQVQEKQLKQKEENDLSGYAIHDDSENNDAFVWVSDLSQHSTQQANSIGHAELFNLNAGDTASLLSSADHLSSDAPIKNTAQSVYTIPVNATLTGTTLMTPLVGRIPIDGKLTAPYAFKAVISADNLTANGYPMPEVHGAVVSGIASGDLLGSCARGEIHSITFIFNDGTISTTQAQGDGNSLGYISSQTGDPCLVGSFHSDAALFLGAQMALAGAQGYANAFSSSQYMNGTTDEGEDIHTLIGSANKAALGQGGATASEAAEQWWNQRVQNSFDYVYVSNVDPTTQNPMKIVINITQEIAIDHDTAARKVNYGNLLQTINNNLD